MSDRNLFNQIVYTPLSDAIRLLEERQKDKELIAKVEKLLEGDIPEVFGKPGKYAVNIDQVATPNFGTRRFIKLASEFNLKPVFSEFYDDLLRVDNDYKHYLGEILISKHGKEISEKVVVVDFKKYNRKKIKDVLTVWGEPLINFHRKLFEAYSYPEKDLIFYDASKWLERNGKKANKYYKKDLLIYICHGILFENFLFKGKESGFTKNIFLPAFEHVVASTGVKPLIVPVSPLDTEEDLYGFCYDERVKSFINLPK